MINNRKLENIKQQEYIRDNEMEYKTLLKKSIQEPKIITLSYYNSPFLYKKVSRDIEKIKTENIKRCWKTSTIFFYSDESRVAKGYLLSLLFLNVYERRNADGKFWEGFKAIYKEILINKFKGDIKFLELLNLLDKKDYSVQTKGSSVEFSSYVIAFSANTNIRFVYKFSEDGQLKPKAYQNHNNT
ncbi:15236_t:CDS:1, partial [Gigaspora margarita]